MNHHNSTNERSLVSPANFAKTVQDLHDLVRETANSCQASNPKDHRITEHASSTKRRAIRGRPFARTGHPSTTPRSKLSSSASGQSHVRANPLGKSKPLSNVICQTCKSLTKLYHVHKTSQCQTCTLGGKYFPHYALAFVSAALSARKEDEEHIETKLSRLMKESVLSRRDIDLLMSPSHQPQPNIPTKHQRFTIAARASPYL